MEGFANEQDCLYTKLIQLDEPSHQISGHFDNSSNFNHNPAAIANQTGSASDHYADSVKHDHGCQRAVAQPSAARVCYWCSGTGAQRSGGKNIECYSCGGSGIGAR